MSLQCGIVGLPNVGKSCLFNALTKAEIPSENYPFCTTDPHMGVVQVPDPRLQKIAEIVNPANLVPTATQFVDIAGLVEGASKGEGLGNQFLANIRETDAIVHVVRCFEDDNIVHVAGKVDPIADIETIDTELALADLEQLEKRHAKVEKQSRSGDKEAKQELEALTALKAHMEQGLTARSFNDQELLQVVLRKLQLLTSKPVLYAANFNETTMSAPDTMEKILVPIRELAKQQNAIVVPICIRLEAEILELPEDEKAILFEDLGIKHSQLDELIHQAYGLLNLQTFFTAGKKEVRAWTTKINSTAPQAAGAIHTDFEKGFIRAEVIAYDDYVQYNGEQGAKEAGKWRLEGKDYVVQEGDVMLFRFNV